MTILKYLGLSLLFVFACGFMIGGLWLPIKAELAYGMMEQAFITAKEDGTPTKPWPWADFKVLGKLSYRGESVYLLNTASGEALAFGAGFHGELKDQVAGTQILSGHRDTHFELMRDMKYGDTVEVELMTDAETLHVSDLKIINVKAGPVILKTSDQLILSTCWPFDGLTSGTDLRYLVFLKSDKKIKI